MGKHFVHNESWQIPVGSDEVEVPFHTLADSFLQRLILIAYRTQDDVPQHIDFLGYNPLEEVVLGAEVVVEHGVGHSGRFGYGGGPCPGISFLEELLFGCFKNPRFCVLRMVLFFVHIIII